MVSTPGTEVKVRDVMRKEIVTVAGAENLVTISKLMNEHNIGSIVVVSKNGSPVGIVTERDIVKRVTSQNLISAEVKASQVMSKPLITVDPEVDITDAMKKMKRLGVRRLVVIDKKDMVGIVSAKDIVDITPALIDVVAEKSRISAVPIMEKSMLAGRCDLCGTWSNNLREADGKFLCEDCQADAEEEGKVH